jgi:hypothetical protein
VASDGLSKQYSSRLGSPATLDGLLHAHVVRSAAAARRGLSRPYERLEFSGSSFSLSTIRQSSATDAALIAHARALR